MKTTSDIIPWANSVLQSHDHARTLNKAHPQPAIFVVGVPRSGTTILHQMVVRRLRIGYIDNLIARFWGCPSLGIAISKELITENERVSLSLSSDLGRTLGPAGPHEFGYFWNYWFGFTENTPHKLSAAKRAAVDLTGLGATLSDMQHAFGLPLVFKNLTCGLQADLVQQAYPQALFVYVERDPAKVARSILAARQRMHGNYHQWWSIRPAGWPEGVPDGGPVAEVIWQIEQTRAQVRRCLTGVPHIVVPYSDVLEQPETVIQAIAHKVRIMGGIVRERGEPLQPLSKPKPPSISRHFITLLEHLKQSRSCFK